MSASASISRRLADEPEPVANPLDDRAADEDASLQRVGRPPAERPRDRRQQPVARGDRRLARVLEQEAARPVGVLGEARRQAHLPEERRLLVARRSRRPGRLAERGARGAVDLARAADLGQEAARNAKEPQQLLVPVEPPQVEEHGPRRVADVGDVRGAARQLPDEPGVDRAERQPARLGPLARALDVLQDPRELGRREIRVDHQAGALADPVLEAVRLEALAEIGRAPVLPDDRVVDRPRRSPDPRRSSSRAGS